MQFSFLGDQILDVDGVNVSNMTIEQVSEVLKAAPILMTCTVKPANHFKYAADEPSQQTQKSSYAEIDIDALAIEDPNDNHKGEPIEAGYEDDQSSTGSQGYVIMPSDDELEDGDHLYENPQADSTEEVDEDSSEYVNMPDQEDEKPKNAIKLKTVSPQKAAVPVGQRNYLELCFDDDETWPAPYFYLKLHPFITAKLYNWKTL